MRRVAALTGALILLAGGTAACGSDSGDEVQASGEVTVTGDFGKVPKVKYSDGPVVFEETETQTLINGKGAKIGDGGAFVNVYIGNAYTGKEASSTWKDDRTLMVQEGSNTLKVFNDVLKDARVGDRVQVDATSKYAFQGQGNAQLFVGDQDSVVFVIDVVSAILDKPTGRDLGQPSGMPKLVESNGKVTALDFAGLGDPVDKLQRKMVVVGKGPKIQKDSSVAIRYLGQVWKGKEPFDENYSADAPGLASPSGGVNPLIMGQGAVIKGWDPGLVGFREGSRVMLSVPPEFGYGDAGKDRPKTIKKDDTLVFVIDILGVQ